MGDALRTGTLMVGLCAGVSACTAILGGFAFEESSSSGGGGTGGVTGTTTSTGGTTGSSTTGSGGTGGAPQCTVPAECPDPGNECVHRTCEAGKCGTAPEPTGTALAAQTAGDCQKAVCDGNGVATSVADDGDVPADGTVCTTDSCDKGFPVFTAVSGACGENGGKVCADLDSWNAGSCVACTVATQGDYCSGTDVCLNGACVPGHCLNGILDGGETDYQCGGSCPPCVIGQKCNTQSDCTLGVCAATHCEGEPIADNQAGPGGITVHGSYVYWVTETTIMKASLSGGGAMQVHAAASGHFRGIAVDATNIYWKDAGSGASTGAIMAVPLTGGTPTPLVTGQPFSNDLPYLITLVAHDTSVYWATPIEILKVPGAGGKAVSLASGVMVTGLAVDSVYVYWTDAGDGTIKRAPLDGGAMETLVTGLSAPQGIAVDAGHLYWGDGGGGDGLAMAPVDGGTPTTLISSGGDARITVLDGSIAYVLLGASIVKRELALSNGAPKVLALADGFFGGLAQDANSLYWNDTNTGRVVKIQK